MANGLSDFAHSSEIRFSISTLKKLEESRQLLNLWGWQHNIEWHLDEKDIDYVRIKFPYGLAGSMRDENRPSWRSGAGFLVTQGVTPADHYRLSYKVRFPPDFDFKRGGKLPGLYGGTAPTGGVFVDGVNGFTSRFMWRKNGDGEVYLYAPQEENTDPTIHKNDKWGMSVGRGKWNFDSGKNNWHSLLQEVTLNNPREKNGVIKVVYDGEEVLDKTGVVFRTSDQLKINGMCFSTFFGGNDILWAPEKDIYADFADFVISQ